MNNDRIKSLTATLNAIENDAGITPIVLVTHPGVGTLSALRTAAELSERKFYDIRCALLHPSEVKDLSVMGPDGEIRDHKPSFALLRNCSQGDEKHIIILDEGAKNPNVVRVVVEQLIAEGALNVALVIPTTEEDVAEAEAAFANAFGEESPAIQRFELVTKKDVRTAIIGFAEDKGFAPAILDCLKNTNILEDVNLRQLTSLDQILIDEEIKPSDADVLKARFLGEEKAAQFDSWLATQTSN